MKMESIVLRFLQDLARIDKRYPQVYETDVQENIHSALLEGFIKRTPSFYLPESFDMLSSEGDALLREALARFLADANEEARRLNCFEPNDRIALVRDADVPPPDKGNYYANFFRDADIWLP